MSKEVAKYQFEIPFFFLMSDKFIRNHPDMAQTIEQSSDRPLINSNIKHTLLRLGGIECGDYKASRDILSDKYDSHTKRLIGDNVDYDGLMQN